MKTSLLIIFVLSAFISNGRLFKPEFSLLEKATNNAGNLEEKLIAGSSFLETSSELLGNNADGSSKTGSESFIQISRNGENNDSFLQTRLTKGGTRVGENMVFDDGLEGNSEFLQLTKGGTRSGDMVSVDGLNSEFLQIGTELTKGGTRVGDMVSVDGFKSRSEDFV